MKRTSFGGAWLAVVVLGCAVRQSEPPAVAKPSHAVPVRAPEPPAQYVASGARLRSALDLNGHYGIVDRDLRIEVDRRGRFVASKRSLASVSTAIAVPTSAGGGVLFDGGGLSRAADFLGEETPLLPFDVPANGLSFGPAGALVVTSDGARFLLDLTTGKTRRSEPLGASRVGLLDGGVGAAIVDGGFAFASSDGGKTWTDVSSRLGAPAVDLQTMDGALVVLADAGPVLRIDARGVSPAGAIPSAPPPARPLTSRGQAFIDAAMIAGAPIDDAPTPARALLVDAGTPVTVDLATGDVVDSQPGLLPPDQPCAARRFSSEMVVLCSHGARAVVASAPAGKKLAIEHSFTSPGSFVLGDDDALLFTGPCGAPSAGPAPSATAPRAPARVCVRTITDSGDVRWVELDRSAELSDTDPKNPTRPILFVPDSNGGALALLAGGDPGILDMKSGERSHVEPPDAAEWSSLVSMPGTNDDVVDRYRVGDGESIEGYAPDGTGFRIEGGKGVEHSSFAFPNVRVVGGRALASASGKLWQSSDYGRTFVEVAPPPTGLLGAVPASCSPAGCSLGTWLRIGWEARPPAGFEADPPISAAISPAPPDAPKLPALVCRTTGPVEKHSADLAEALPGLGADTLRTNGVDVYQLTCPRRVMGGGSSGFTDSISLRAAALANVPVTGDAPPTAFATSTDRKFTYVEPFDPKAAKKRATIRLETLLGVVVPVGASQVDAFATSEVGTPTPVLGDAGGLLVSGQSGPALWLRDTRVVPLVLDTGSSQPTPVSIVETKPDELTALLLDADVEVVRSLRPGSSTELWRLPRVPPGAEPLTADALAVDKSGALAIIRVPSGAPPTELSPALLLEKGKPPVALAPWSTLVSADAPECAGGEGHRAILQVVEPWITLGASTEVSASTLTTMRVRWSAERVCLEAAEVQAPPIDTPIGQVDGYVAVDFTGKSAGAGLVVIGSGVELREPRACTLARGG